MCIINTTHGFVFVHIPKTAGTSVCQALAKHCGVLDIELGGTAFGEAIQTPYLRRHGLRKHSTAQEIRERIGAERWASMSSFAVLRDPVERLASAYRFLKGWNSPLNTAREQMQALPTFSDFVASGQWEQCEGLDQLFLPQAHWVLGADGEPLVQNLLHFTQLQTGLLWALSKADATVNWQASIKHMGQLNASKAEPIALSAALQGRLRHRYGADYQLLDKTPKGHQRSS
ncbi:MAG: sulfotransferase family 2 domain-containing protein [Ideonella sp.]|nr:sulfotransferase family 2 domain-containing protein [Ideonella sp.]